MRVKSTQPPGFAADLIGSRAYLGFNYLERSKCQIPKSEEMIEGILAGSPFRSEPQVGKPPLPQQLAHMARKQATGRGGGRLASSHALVASSHNADVKILADMLGCE